MGTVIKKLSKAKRRLADQIRAETTREFVEAVATVAAQHSFQQWISDLTDTTAGDLLECPEFLIEHVRSILREFYDEEMSNPLSTNIRVSHEAAAAAHACLNASNATYNLMNEHVVNLFESALIQLAPKAVEGALLKDKFLKLQTILEKAA